MRRGAELIGFVLLFDIVVIGGYLLLTGPLGRVVWIVSTLALFSLVIAAYLFGRLSSDAAWAAQPPHRSGESNRSFRQRPSAFSEATPDSSGADTRNRTPAERRSTGVGERRDWEAHEQLYSSRDWRAGYRNCRPHGGLNHPGGIVLPFNRPTWA